MPRADSYRSSTSRVTSGWPARGCATVQAPQPARAPFSGAGGIAGGITGSRDGVPVVASPMRKQDCGLRTGVCMDDPGVHLPVLAPDCRGRTNALTAAGPCPVPSGAFCSAAGRRRGRNLDKQGHPSTFQDMP
ncbi:nitrite reductase (NAD(P)H) small subunit [Streptomyces sp. cmx-4-9]|uniref:nitrite reductase (NAD(P)H) small subunit n=1 Tax=Streptomyces sp. cmx-4-9 TaxID=2790941 RepID=UPI00397F6ADC